MRRFVLSFSRVAAARRIQVFFARPGTAFGISCILGSQAINRKEIGRASSRIPGPEEAACEPDAMRPIARSKARTVGGAAPRRARIKLQGRVTALSATGSAGMSAVNAAIEVGKHKLDIAPQ